MHSSASTDQKQYQCNKCKDENGTLKIIDGLERWVLCECIESKRINRIIKSSAITEEFRKKEFGNFELNDKAEVVKRAYVTSIKYESNFETISKSRKNSISLLGKAGSGKTHLLCAVANKLIDRGIETLYFPYVEGMNDLKSNFEIMEEKIDRIKKVNVLFIDDLFKGRTDPTPWQIEQVFSIINYRYLNHLPVLISSEKDVDQLIEIDEAIGSRIFEMSKDHIVILKGNKINYRMGGF